MNWTRVLIILLFVAGGLWVFTPGAHQPVEVTQMEIGFLNGEEFGMVICHKLMIQVNRKNR